MRRNLLKILSVGCVLAGLVGVPARSATPDHGTVTLANNARHPLTYSAGPFTTPNAFGTLSYGCAADPGGGVPNPEGCDLYQLKMTLPAGYARANPQQHLFVRIDWSTPAANFDLYLFDAKGYVRGTSVSPLAESTQTATNFQQVEIALDNGSGAYVVQVNSTVPAGQSFT